MKAVGIILGTILLVLAVGGFFRYRRRKRRREVADIRLSEAEQALLTREVPLYRQLPAPLKPKLEGVINVFLHEIGFEPCGALEEVTREMQLVIGAQAGLLLLESGYEHFGRLRTVLVYPNAYSARSDAEGESVRLGESWETGSVVLSWESVKQGSRNAEDGLNVVLHEFAHQLDQFDGTADGLPRLKERGDYREWAETLQACFDSLVAKVERGDRTVLDEYGATNPAEFFAVATETFFEKPHQLVEEHEELFRQLRRFYGLDPLSWESE